ncbi:hypothetical protein GOBAR_AA24664 [Gossypium barbadense]|uniref:Arabidopsis retrotransposon Orf1 C-terminal domain-containing protein n=1 Tax=Gossypium barbadense TaxID=3634 RepID=A0A2P5WY36_GOSBA|nr:hypothetical protein GOBAR_AA24664 [Gossypium barbadense]
MADAIRALLTTDPWELFFRIIELTYLELMIELFSTFHIQTVMTRYDNPGTVQFCLGGLSRQLSVPEFGVALSLYTKEFREENELHALSHHIHFSHSKCWQTLAPSTASYNSSRSKASVLPPSLRYLHAILAHTIIGRRKSTGIVNTHDVYFLWCMSQGHHEDDREVPGTYPPQYRLAQSPEEEAYEDILDNVLPQHEDPPAQSPPLSRPVYAAASYADISECLT